MIPAARLIRLGLLYGGVSAEHAVSLASARNVYGALDKSRYEVALLWIDEAGKWHAMESPGHLRGEVTQGTPVLLSPHGGEGRTFLAENGTRKRELALDVVFPVLHGTNGEDGSVQGLLQMLGVPFVGAGVLASSVCMDKEVAKRLLMAASLPIADFVVLKRGQGSSPGYEALEARLGIPFFLKPANTGSSVGISKVYGRDEFAAGLEHAFAHDKKILAERFIPGRELECAVIGNENPQATVVGEIRTGHDFYSYEAKYLDEKATQLLLPAPISPPTSERIRSLALEAYNTLECEGMARVDFFLNGDDDVFINELNTIPGFTSQSMFPLLWQHSGVSFSRLVDLLIEAAFERHAADMAIRRHR